MKLNRNDLLKFRNFGKKSLTELDELRASLKDVYKRQVLNHVLLHQTIIGEEAVKQMELFGEYPDVVIGCFGGRCV